MFASLLYAEGPAVAQGSAAAAGPAAGFMQMVPLIFIFVVFYFLLIRPQQKRAKEHQKMIDNVQKGDEILTSGGIYGTVVGLRAGIIDLKIAEDVNIRISKSAIASVVKDEKAVEPEVVKK